jgi:hypothetical protein
VLAALAVLLVAGAVIAAVLVSGNDKSPAPGPTPNPPPNVPSGPTAQQGVTQIAEVLDLSRRGRTLTASGNFSAAIENRRQVLQQLGGLQLVPELEASRTLLKAAMRASIDADEALIQCTDCASTRSANEHASALKNDFAIEFNPFARKYLNQQFDPGSF